MAAGDTRNMTVLGLLVGAVLLQPVACGPGGNGKGPTQEALGTLESVWPHVLEPASKRARRMCSRILTAI